MNNKIENTIIVDKRETLNRRLELECPKLDFDRLNLVDPINTLFAIDDVSYKTEDSCPGIQMLTGAMRGSLQIYDSSVLAKALEVKLQKLLGKVDAREAIIIFPGSGSQVVAEILENTTLKTFRENGGDTLNLQTRRDVNSQTLAIEGVTIPNKTDLRDKLKEKTKTIIVLDDVIATGATIGEIRTILGPSFEPDFYAGAMITLSPFQIKKSKSKTFNMLERGDCTGILSPIIYQGISGTPPLNSISTLVGTSEKSELVRKRYMARYVYDAEEFMKGVAQLQSALK